MGEDHGLSAELDQASLRRTSAWTTRSWWGGACVVPQERGRHPEIRYGAILADDYLQLVNVDPATGRCSNHLLVHGRTYWGIHLQSEGRVTLVDVNDECPNFVNPDDSLEITA